MEINRVNNSTSKKHSTNAPSTPRSAEPLSNQITFRVSESTKPIVHSHQQSDCQNNYKIINRKFVQAKIPAHPQATVTSPPASTQVASRTQRAVTLAPKPPISPPNVVIFTPHIGQAYHHIQNQVVFAPAHSPNLWQAYQPVQYQLPATQKGHFTDEDVMALACVCALNPHLTLSDGVDRLLHLAMRQIDPLAQQLLTEAWCEHLQVALYDPRFRYRIQLLAARTAEEEMFLIFHKTFAKLENLGTFYLTDAELSLL